MRALPTAEPDFVELRRTMVDCQIRTFGVTDHAVIARFLEVPRERFVAAEQQALAYSDLSLKVADAAPGAESRCLLMPMVLARLLQDAEVRKEDKVLDIAPGTGYSTAILSGLADQVTALEADSKLKAVVKSNLAACGFDNIPVIAGLLPDGVAERAPFDLIFVNGATEGRLDRLFGQLGEGARLITLSRAPSDPDRFACHAVRFEKIAGQISSRILFDVAAPVLSAFREVPHFVF
jgi:protein-L-isoaspartate(D-aspartate) O-methyltransferase